MSGFRKVVGVLIIVFIGLPCLFGVIWGVGVTRAVVSSEFLSEIPKEIISKIPTMLDETIEAVDQEGVIDDEETRAWVRAVADADMSPRELLEKIGIMDWLQTELSQSLEDIGKILRGEMRPKPILLNMRPLKAALLHNEIDNYLLKLLEKLPPCSEQETKEWLEAALRGETLDDLPPCRPIDPQKAVEVLRMEWEKEVQDIPDEVNIFNIERRYFFRDSGLDIARTVVSMTYFLFLIPAFFIFLGALIAASSGPGILRWMGWATLIGGGLTYAFSRLVGNLITYGTGFGPVHYSQIDLDINFPLFQVFSDKAGDIALIIVNHLFSAVDSVAGAVCIVGIIMIALSYFFTPEKKPATRTTQSTPQTPQAPQTPQTPQAPQSPQAQQAPVEPAPESSEPKVTQEPEKKD